MSKCPVCQEEVTCPDCGSSEGALGTSYAYFVCANKIHNGDWRERYWYKRDLQTPNQTSEWKLSVLAAPHGFCGSGRPIFFEDLGIGNKIFRFKIKGHVRSY